MAEAQTGVHCLISTAFPEKGYLFMKEGVYVIGRDPDCDISIPSRQISRRHSTVELLKEGWSVRDLGSTNGTRINGLPVSEHGVMLQDGDEVQIGPFFFRYRFATDSQTLKRWLEEAEKIEAHHDTDPIETPMLYDETEEMADADAATVSVGTGLAGVFGPGDIAMMCRHLERTRATGALKVVAEGMALMGKIHFNSGVIVTARAGTFRNEEAVRQLADLAAGEQSFDPVTERIEEEVCLRASVLFK